MTHWENQVSRPGQIRSVSAGLYLLIVWLFLISAVGCTRHFYRGMADKEVFGTICEKDVFPHWKIHNFFVYPDGRARFADPANPDHPPKPPDDPAAAALSPNPQPPRHAGIGYFESNTYLKILAQWDVENRALRELEKQKGEDERTTEEKEEQNPDQPSKMAYIYDENISKQAGVVGQSFLITLDQAVNLGLINSREFQTRREDLYLTALPVALQRFAFASQFYFTEQAVRDWVGRNYPWPATSDRNRWVADTNTGFTKLFPTGALLTLQFANETIINLSNNFRDSSISHINLDIIQPFLRGGGRAVTLEALTQAERNLVYEIRNFARFRKQFYTFIAGNGTISPPGPIFTGTAAFGAGIVPGSVIGAAVSGISPQVRPAVAGRVILDTGPEANPQGYIPTLLLAAVLTNQQKNIRVLESLLELFIAYEKAGIIDSLQVNRVETTLLGAQFQMMQQGRNWRVALDQFKIQLGLPVCVQLELDNTPVRPLVDHLDRYERTYLLAKDAFTQIDKLSELKNPLELRPRLRKLLTGHKLVRGTNFKSTFEKRWQEWKVLSPDTQRKNKAGETYLQEGELTRKLMRLDTQFKNLRANLEKEEFEQGKTDEVRHKQLEALSKLVSVGWLEKSLRDFEAQPWLKAPNPIEEKIAKLRIGSIVRNAAAQLINEAAEERLDKLRSSWPDVPPVLVEGLDILTADLEPALCVAVKTALTNRVDLMNVRAQVVDAWRQLRIYANSLLGVFNVEYNLDAISPVAEADPFSFTGSRMHQQLIFNAQLPIVRKAERNSYRAALIGLQRARRALQANEDFIAFGVRTEIRDLRLFYQQYKIQQKAVDLAYSQLESAQQTFVGARDPNQASRIANPNAAALTQQILSAQQNLLGTWNALYAAWVNYQLARLNLYRDLGIMYIDPRGVWIDELANCPPRPSTPGNAGASSSSQPGQQPEQLPTPQSLPPALLGTPR